MKIFQMLPFFNRTYRRKDEKQELNLLRQSSDENSVNMKYSYNLTSLRAVKRSSSASTKSYRRTSNKITSKVNIKRERNMNKKISVHVRQPSEQKKSIQGAKHERPIIVVIESKRSSFTSTRSKPESL
jgi:hypothetical protein